MNLKPSWNWLRSMTRGTPADDTTEAADMGTAFGLDASFQEVPEPLPLDQLATGQRLVSPLTGLPRN